jgi:hypothetical protein
VREVAREALVRMGADPEAVEPAPIPVRSRF